MWRTTTSRKWCIRLSEVTNSLVQAVIKYGELQLIDSNKSFRLRLRKKWEGKEHMVHSM